jgi:hypothetical protein
MKTRTHVLTFVHETGRKPQLLARLTCYSQILSLVVVYGIS